MGLVSAVGLGMAKISHWSNSKGQLISKCPFGVKISSKNPMKLSVLSKIVEKNMKK